MRKVKENWKGLKLNGTHQLLVYAGDATMLGGNTNTIRRNKEALLEASKEVGLEVNTEKTKYVVVSHHQNSGENHHLLTVNKSLKNMGLS
jgi:hypothetical protein